MSPILQSKERKKEEDSLTRRENRYKSKTKKERKDFDLYHTRSGGINR